MGSSLQLGDADEPPRSFSRFKHTQQPQQTHAIANQEARSPRPFSTIMAELQAGPWAGAAKAGPWAGAAAGAAKAGEALGKAIDAVALERRRNKEKILGGGRPDWFYFGETPSTRSNEVKQPQPSEETPAPNPYTYTPSDNARNARNAPNAPDATGTPSNPNGLDGPSVAKDSKDIANDSSNPFNRPILTEPNSPPSPHTPRSPTSHISHVGDLITPQAQQCLAEMWAQVCYPPMVVTEPPGMMMAAGYPEYLVVPAPEDVSVMPAGDYGVYLDYQASVTAQVMHAQMVQPDAAEGAEPQGTLGQPDAQADDERRPSTYTIEKMDFRLVSSLAPGAVRAGAEGDAPAPAHAPAAAASPPRRKRATKEGQRSEGGDAPRRAASTRRRLRSAAPAAPAAPADPALRNAPLSLSPAAAAVRPPSLPDGAAGGMLRRMTARSLDLCGAQPSLLPPDNPLLPPHDAPQAPKRSASSGQSLYQQTIPSGATEASQAAGDAAEGELATLPRRKTLSIKKSLGTEVSNRPPTASRMKATSVVKEAQEAKPRPPKRENTFSLPTPSVLTKSDAMT